MTRFVSRHPITFSILAVLLAVAGIMLLGAGLAYLKLSELGGRLIVEAVFCAYVIALLIRLRWWREAGFKQPVARRKLWACLPLLFLPIVVALTTGFKSAPASLVIGFAVFTLMVGFAEEGLMRGVALRAMLPGGVTRAVLLSSVFFGLGHLLSISHSYSLSAAIVQMVYSTLLGIGFAGARLYTGSIWPAIGIHSLIDLTDIAGRGFAFAVPRSLTPARVIVPIVITGLYALYGWWLIRRLAKSVASV